MLFVVHVPVDNVVFATNEDTGWAIKLVRRRRLAARHLDKEVRARVRGLAPFADHMVQTEVELIERQHLQKLKLVNE